MDTEQAHSSHTFPLGRDAALRPPRTVSTERPWKAQRAVPATERTPATWLNLVCLDAPLVSVAWLWLFSRTFHAAVDPVSGAALFLTAWLIYLADRLADSCSLQRTRPRSLRHEFCLSHRQIWVGALVVIAVTDAWLIRRGISAEALLGGAVVGPLAAIYLVLNYSSGGAWPRLPLKEFAVGFLFAAGTLVALFPSFPLIKGSFVSSGIAFSLLCTLNCICIAFWERELDETQGKISFATRYPGFDSHLRKASIVLALISAVMAIRYRDVAQIFGCVVVSALLLAVLDSLRGRIGRDQRTALADLVFLAPVVVLFVLNA